MGLQKQGHKVHYANYSFSNLKEYDSERLSDVVVQVDHNTHLPNDTYFPEIHFSAWCHRTLKRKTPVFCFEKTGVQPLKHAYNLLHRKLNLDACLLIDGGIDGIFRGDEYGLGTPSMDSISMIAANLSDIPLKHYAFTAFGSEGVNQEVCHSDALARTAELIQNNGYFGVSALVNVENETKLFVDACDFIFSKMPAHQHSNIVCSILSALRGDFGYVTVNEKTKIHPIWVSALTNMYWFFDLDKAARLKLFYDDAVHTSTVEEMASTIEKYRPNPKTEQTRIPI